MMVTLWILTFLAVTLGALGTAMLLLRTPLERRVARLDGATASDEFRPDGPGWIGTLEAALAPVARLSGGDREAVRKRLVQAGFRNERAAVLFLGGRSVAPVLGTLAALFLSSALELAFVQRMTLLFILGAGGYLAPGIALDRIRVARETAIRQSLPNALDLLLVCLEAGLALSGALGRVARELARSAPALCDELRLVTREMQAGKSSQEALEAFATRVDTPEVRALVAMLVQSERFGTGVADALRVHTSGMRRDRIQRAEESAQKAAIKMLVPAAFFIFPATLVVVLGPAAIRMFETLGAK